MRSRQTAPEADNRVANTWRRSTGAIRNAVSPTKTANPAQSELYAFADEHADPEVEDERTAIMEFEAEESRQVATGQ